MIKITTNRPEVKLPPAKINVEDLDDNTIITRRELLGSSMNPTDDKLWAALRMITDGGGGTLITRSLIVTKDGGRIQVSRSYDPDMWDKMLANVREYRRKGGAA